MAGDAALPYGWLGVLAAMHFGLWYYLGIEGTTQAAEEVRSPARALPFGTLAGIMTLLIAATAHLVRLRRPHPLGVPGRRRQRLGGAALRRGAADGLAAR